MSPQLACAPFATVDEVLESACACDLNDDDHGLYIEELIDDASDMLYVLSGGQFTGRCERQVWPVKTCTGYQYGIPERESWIAYDSVDSIPLRGPNTEIIEVTIDGAVVSPADYGLLDGTKLFRRGDRGWPTRNDLTLTDVDDGTFTITYKFGLEPNHVVRRATVELVCQMVKEEPRAISRMRGVVSANVQGVSVQIDDDDVRSLGLPEVNRFIDSYAHNGPLPFGVYSPELSHGWRLHSVEGPSGS